MTDLASLYDFHAEECLRTAGKTDDPRHRAALNPFRARPRQIGMAEWRKAAQQLRLLQPPSQKLHAQHPASHPKRPGRGQWFSPLS
jgi:hypothetical protein